MSINNARARRVLLPLIGLMPLASCGGLEPSGGRPKAQKPPAADATAAGTADGTSVCPTASSGSTTAALASELTPRLVKYCVACHGAGGTPVSPDLSTFDLALSNASLVTADVASGKMPPGVAMPDGDKAVFAQLGAPVALALTAAPTYEGDIKPMINAKCAWCHSATAAPADRQTPYLTTYAEVEGRALDVADKMSQGIMPPSGAVPTLASGDYVL